MSSSFQFSVSTLLKSHHHHPYLECPWIFHAEQCLLITLDGLRYLMSLDYDLDLDLMPLNHQLMVELAMSVVLFAKKLSMVPTVELKLKLR
ncbi:hypothetical protein HN873_018589 [Arachis hypogaea]